MGFTSFICEFFLGILSGLMVQEEVKVLYARYSPFVMRVIFALELKGIGYEKIEEEPTNKSQLLLQSNPIHKKIPVLIHNGKLVVESAIIVEYIEEAWPEQAGFFPKDPYGRAQARFWGDFVENKLFGPLRSFVTSAKAAPAANKEFIESFIILEDALSKKDEKPFLGGKTVGFADIMLAPLAVWIPAVAEEFGLKVPAPQECPNLHKLITAIRKHPAAKVALPSTEEMRELVRPRFAHREAN